MASLSEHLPDLLRAIVTDGMLILLLCTMAMPKYRKPGLYVGVTLAIVSVNVAFNQYFYLRHDYTAVFHVDLAMLAVIGIALKPLFADSLMQWCFSYVTMVNLYAAVVFLSFHLRHVFPDPAYGHVAWRFLLFAAVVLVFRRWVSRPYRDVLDYWHVYLPPVCALLLCFLGQFAGGDIRRALEDNATPLTLLTLLGLSMYAAIIHSLQTIRRQHRIEAEHQAIRHEREHLRLATDGMAARLGLLEEVSARNSRAAHDRRHFNNVLLELLARGDGAQAAALLQAENRPAPQPVRRHCENPAVDAAVGHYAAVAAEAGIRTEIALEIPARLHVDALELAMVVSNLFENAVQACRRLPDGRERFIRFSCRHAGRLLLELENACGDDAALDAAGRPVARDEGHGLGSLSVHAFAKKYDAELLYRIDAGRFRVRLLV